MISVLVAPLLLQVGLSPDPVGDRHVVLDRSFFVMGWRCDGEGCASNPRRLIEDLTFERSATLAALATAEKLDQNWSVTLECATSGDRLHHCSLGSETEASAPVRKLALKMVRSFRIRHRASDAPLVRPGAVITIHYETSACPSWICTFIPTPPPPPPPPEKPSN